jgi:L-lactate dehydrogenase
MKKTSNKIVLIGAGAVGTSFLYSAINQGLASDYVLIDAFPNAAEGNALDLADTAPILPRPFTNIKAGDYADVKDADLVVITAGRPQKPGETRLEMVAGNAVIMKEIALSVKKSGFDGVTVIASNPVDVLTTVYQEVTGFDAHKVISSGTTLDSVRLRRLVGSKLGVNPVSVDAYLMGEHGDSSVAAWSHASVMGQPISAYVQAGKLQESDLKAIRDEAVMMAYKIIELKRATFYGIGACLARISKAVLNDEKSVLMIGAKVDGQYNTKGIYIGVPAIISRQGWDEIIEWKLTAEEQELFTKSATTLLESVEKARAAIK